MLKLLTGNSAYLAGLADTLSEVARLNLKPQAVRNGTLTAEFIAVVSLDESLIQEMWFLFENYYDDVDFDRFRSDLGAKREVILLRDKGDGSLQGFSTLTVFNKTLNGQRFIAIYSGDTIIHRDYWGQNALQKAFFWYLVKTWFSNPGVDVYWYLISKGYKTYLLLANNFPNYWPRYDSPTPAPIAEIIDCLSREMFGNAWVPEKGILRFSQPLGSLKPDVAPVSAAARSQPHIRYFCEQNPHHADGDELCCVGRVDRTLLLSYPFKVLRKITHWRKNGSKKP